MQAVTISLSMVGFGESIASLIHQESVWISRVIAVGILLLLLGNCICAVTFCARSLVLYHSRHHCRVAGKSRSNVLVVCLMITGCRRELYELLGGDRNKFWYGFLRVSASKV